MLERKLPGESENRPMHRESAASHGVCNVREIRETGPRELAGFAPLGCWRRSAEPPGNSPRDRGVDILRPRRYDLDVVVRCGLRGVRSLLVLYWYMYMFRYFEIVT
jgi:hypothetical protein